MRTTPTPDPTCEPTTDDQERVRNRSSFGVRRRYIGRARKLVRVGGLTAVGSVLIGALAVASVFCTCLAMYSRSRRHATPAASSLAVTLFGCSTWAAADLLAMLGLPVAAQLWALKVSFAGIYLTVLGLYFLCSSLVDSQVNQRRSRQLAAGVVALAMFVVILVLPVPGLVLRRVRFGGFGDMPRQSFGPLFWAHTALCYLVLGAALFLLLRAYRRAAAVFRAQLRSLLFSALIPIVGNILTLLSPSALQGRDLTPLLFTCTALLAAWALLRQGLLRIIPVARDRVLESIGDSVVVVDAQDRIVDTNPSARRLAQRLRPDLPVDLVGLHATCLGTMLDQPEVTELAQRTVELLGGYHVDVRTTVLSDSRGRLLGRVVVCRDISNIVAARTELERQLALVETLRGELVEQTLRDPLTGVHNRRYLSGALRVALSEADRSGEPVALLVVDVDRFKTINDELGHQAGDRALVSIARSLAAHVRAGDTVARFGGEEFVVVLPGACRSEAQFRAEQLRVICGAAVHFAPNEKRANAKTSDSAIEYGARQVTVSIGLACYRDDAPDAEGLIAAADQALYVAKASGRNRVVDAARCRGGLSDADPIVDALH